MSVVSVVAELVTELVAEFDTVCCGDGEFCSPISRSNSVNHAGVDISDGPEPELEG
jgi:hypothetical protein